MNKLATLKQYSFFNAFEIEIANLNKVEVNFGLMQIWLTVLAEGFSSAGGLVLLSKSCFASHRASKKSKQFKSEPRAMLK
jgi:hypothetical protein